MARLVLTALDTREAKLLSIVLIFTLGEFCYNVNISSIVYNKCLSLLLQKMQKEIAFYFRSLVCLSDFSFNKSSNRMKAAIRMGTK